MEGFYSSPFFGQEFFKAKTFDNHPKGQLVRQPKPKKKKRVKK